MLRRGIPEDAIPIMLASLSHNTFKQYDTSLKKWFDYCQQNSKDAFCPSVTDILCFLTHVYNTGAKYGTLNSCRSALSLLVGQRFVNNDSIQRFLKGVFRLRPTLPKYNLTWNVDLVLNFLANWHPNEELDLEKLTKKLITLLALVTAHRVLTFSLIKVDNICLAQSGFIIKIPDLIKTSLIGSEQPILSLPYYSEKTVICPANTLTVYLSKSQQIRKDTEFLFISFRKPHRAVSSQTLSRWIKSVLENSSIDTNVFSAHSTRHASASRALKAGVTLDTISSFPALSAVII